MTIGVFFGSRTPEHDVSIITGTLVCKTLKSMGKEVVPIYIDKEGIWYISEELGDIAIFKEKNYLEKIQKYKGYTLELSENRKLKFVKKGFLGHSIKYDVDLCFPCFHGQNGEDGSIQGMFEMLNVAYVGCGIFSSSIAIDKVLTKEFYQRFNIPTTNFVPITRDQWLENEKKIIEEISSNLTWPVFIKPSRLGSSIGISKANNSTDLRFGIEVALHYDTKILVEESVEDLMDITVCVIGNKDPKTSLIQESSYSKDFFSYEDKYLKGGGTQTGKNTKSIIIPAPLDAKTTSDIQSMALEIYKIFGCKGIARIDFLYDKTFKKYYANEINPLPGTLYHHLWKKSGVEFEDLLNLLIDYAMEEQEEKNKITFNFESEILSKASLNKLKA